MNKSMTIHVDQRWYDALAEKFKGKRLEDKLEEYIDSLIEQLPASMQDCISQEIRKEEQERNSGASFLRITEGGKTAAFRSERGENEMTCARLVRCALRGKSPLLEMLGAVKRISETEFGGAALELMTGSQRVLSVCDVDMDAGRFSMLRDSGWQTNAVGDVNAAVYFADRCGDPDVRTRLNVFNDHMWKNKYQDMPPEVTIRGAKPLPVECLTFSDKVSEMGGYLTFNVDANFDVEAVIGAALADDDLADVCAYYDMKRGAVCDALEVSLMYGNGTELPCRYELSPGERAALLPKMEKYCQEQTGLTLSVWRKQHLAEPESQTMQIV